MATDSCHPMKCESLQTDSSRWVHHDVPHSLDGSWSPAFPHKGTCIDVEKLKLLLKKSLEIFPKGSHICPSLFSHDIQNGTLAASEETAEEAGHQATLKYMVQILKQQGSLFLENNCLLPTVYEITLYALILRQIESYMLLYRMEESFKQDAVPAELIDQAVEQVGCFLAENHIDVDESVNDSFDDCGEDLFNAWGGFDMMTSLVRDIASSMSNMPNSEGVALFETAIESGTTDVKLRVSGHVSTPDPFIFTKNSVAGKKRKASEGESLDIGEAMKRRKLKTAAFDVDQTNCRATESDGNVKAVDDRAVLLLYFLRMLGNIGRMRSYAPPSQEEMKYYRLIWAHAMFSLGLINSKCGSGTPPALPGARTDWVVNFFGSLESTESIPDGWKLTVALGAIPDLITLVKVCKDHVSDSVVGNDFESQKTLQNQHSHGSDTAMAISYFDKLLSQNDEGKSMAKSRIECLRDIICIIKCINWNGLPTTVERRLYSRLVDHVHSSIWMCESETWMRKKHLPSWIAGSGIQSAVKQKPSVGTAENTDVTVGREKNREQCLREIVLLVEAIESSFLDCVPTVEELICYIEIRGHVRKKFVQTARPLMTQIFPLKPQLKLHHIALMDHHMKCVLDLLREAYKQVEEEHRKLLGMVIPISDWEFGKFIVPMSDEDEAALKAFLEERLRNNGKQVISLDLAITILDSARMCADCVFSRTCDAENRLQFLTHKMRYEEGMDEVCHVPGIRDRLLD